MESVTKMTRAREEMNKDLSRPRDMSRFYFLEPDYTRPVFQVPNETREKILERLILLYGEEVAKESIPEIERLMKVHFAHKPLEMIEKEQGFDPATRFSEKDAILITYGDLIKSKDHLPLETLSDFSRRFLRGAINTIHILPFFPYSSDRGFAITNFEEVDPNLGSWENIADIKRDFNLMFDGVFNHASSKSRWFQEFKDGNPMFEKFFIAFSTKEPIPEDYLKLILRPRTTEILSQFYTINGKRSVWTTFSPDQVDLNYKNPKVLLKIIDILLQYVRRGADIIRLDAVTYLWTELGTSCAHLEQTHTVIKLFRDILDAVAPTVAIITETNVPHEENIQYFGNGSDEAQMVYNFALPPLVLHAFQNGSASKLTQWASTLEKVSDTATYFNFLDSHDGIGLMGARGILTEEEIEMMSLKVLEHGGYISYKSNEDNTVSPYELNITWYSALNRDDEEEDTALQVKRFLASRAIPLALMGVPGIYLHGLLGSKNDADAVLEEGQTRSINRRTIDRDSLYRALSDIDTTTYRVAHGVGKMIEKRIHERAFSPNASQQIFNVSDALFAVSRTSEDKKEHIVALVNVTNKKQEISFDISTTGTRAVWWKDILSGKTFSSLNSTISLAMDPYDVLWLKAVS